MKTIAKVLLYAIFSVIGIIMIVSILTGSKINNVNNNATSVRVSDSQLTDASEETDDTEDVSEPDESDATLISDNEYFKAYYQKVESVEDAEGAIGIFLNIENVSEENETYLLEDVYVDGKKINISGSADEHSAKPEDSVACEFVLFTESELSDINKIEFKVKCVDDSFKEIFISDNVTIKQK